MAAGGELAAVVGVGMTKFSATRGDVSMPDLFAKQPSTALKDAEMEWEDIDAVVMGKAPDFFEGVMMPEIFLGKLLGLLGNPCLGSTRQVPLEAQQHL